MSVNELLNKEESEKVKASQEEKKAKKKKKSSNNGGRVMVQIMNGEFLSKDWFVNHLPFTFFIGFLMVVMIGWGYYVETVIKQEVNLKEELSELESEFFTLNSEYNTKKGREYIDKKMPKNGPKESRVTPKKITVKKYVFD